MKRKYYTLKIEDPCKEEWRSMTKNETGKFCSSCSKNVIDFTRMTDKQISETIQNSKGSICGKLSEHQLQKYYSVPKKVTNNSYLAKFFSGLFLFSSLENATANQLEIKDETSNYSLEKEYKENNDPTIPQPEEIPHDSLKNIIQGKIVDINNYPVDYIHVHIKNSTLYTLTDDDGIFRIIIPDSLISDTLILVINDIDYNEIEFKIEAAELPLLNKTFTIEQPHELIFIGMIVTKNAKKKWRKSQRNIKSSSKQDKSHK